MENGKIWLDVLESIGTQEVARALVINYDLLTGIPASKGIECYREIAPCRKTGTVLIRLYQKNISHEISVDCLEALVKIGDNESVEFPGEMFRKSRLFQAKGPRNTI